MLRTVNSPGNPRGGEASGEDVSLSCVSVPSLELGKCGRLLYANESNIEF